MYGITGWSGGGRRPLTYNLAPGQFRNTRVSVFSQPTIINNNIGNFGGCYDYGDCCCGGGNSTPKWMNWMMGIGMGTSLLGGIMNMFGLGGGAKETEGAGEKKTPDTSAKDWVKTIKTSYPDANLSATPDGRYLLNGKIYDTPDDVLAELGKSPEKPAAPATPTTTPTPTTTTTPPPATEEANPFEMLLFKKGTRTYTNAQQEEQAFKDLTGENVYKIPKDFTSVKIDKVVDKGNKTTFNIDDVTIKKGTNGTLTCTPAKVNGKEVSATLLDDKYIRLTVGTQTYIVASDGNAYQYENGNVTGYNDANWRKGS